MLKHIVKVYSDSGYSRSAYYDLRDARTAYHVLLPFANRIIWENDGIVVERHDVKRNAEKIKRQFDFS